MREQWTNEGACAGVSQRATRPVQERSVTELLPAVNVPLCCCLSSACADPRALRNAAEVAAAKGDTPTAIKLWTQLIGWETQAQQRSELEGAVTARRACDRALPLCVLCLRVLTDLSLSCACALLFVIAVSCWFSI